MPARLLVIDVVGLVPSLVGPRLRELAAAGWQRSLRPVFPAVTCTAQASMLTGRRPDGHGIVGNGWYFHDLSEVWLWRQSSRLVQGPKVWETARLRELGLPERPASKKKNKRGSLLKSLFKLIRLMNRRRKDINLNTKIKVNAWRALAPSLDAHRCVAYSVPLLRCLSVSQRSDSFV